jgi:hypothetical protein
MVVKKPSEVLAGLGFTKFSEEDAAQAQQKAERMAKVLSAEKRPIPVQEPFFSCLAHWTMAVDEAGDKWMATTRVDLTPFGFKDKSSAIKRLGREYLDAIRTQ